MPRRRIPDGLKLKDYQDRPGQPCRPNTWKAILLELLPTDHWVGTNKLYQTAAERYPNLEFIVCSQMLCALKKRGFIDRQRITGQPSGEMQQRRLEL